MLRRSSIVEGGSRRQPTGKGEYVSVDSCPSSHRQRERFRVPSHGSAYSDIVRLLVYLACSDLSLCAHDQC